MGQASHELNLEAATTLGRSVHNVQRRWRLRDAVAACALAGALGPAGFGLAWWFDLVWELSPPTRVAANILVAAAAIVGLAALGYQFLARSSVLKVVRRMDAAGQAEGQLLAGFELSRTGGDPGPLSEGLRAMAIRRAADVAAHLNPSEISPWRAVVRSCLPGGAVLAIGGVLALVAPGLITTQWHRFSDPWGDHPPYSRLAFEVSPGNTRVVYGNEAEIDAVVSGGPVAEAELVVVAAGEIETAVPMFGRDAHRWQALLTDLREPVRYFVRAGRARSRRFQIGIISVPQLERIVFRVTPPEYTGLPVVEGPLPQGGISGLRGTRVEVTVESNRPLAHGACTIHAAGKTQELRLRPRAAISGEASQQVSGEFSIDGSGRFELTVTDEDGQRSTDVVRGALTETGDGRPVVRVVRPTAVALATPLATVPVVLDAEDDYGISRVSLFRSLNASRALPLPLSVEPSAGPRWNGTVRLPLGEFGLEPGDEIEVFARAEDNDPAGAKGCESSLARIRIIAEEEMNRLMQQRAGLEMLASKYQQAARRLEALAQELERLSEQAKSDGDEQASAERLQQVAELAQRMSKDAEAIRESAHRELPFDLDRELTGALEELAAALAQSAGQASKLSEQAGIGSPALAAELKQMSDALGTKRKELQDRAIAPIEFLQQIFPLKLAEARFRKLYQSQRELERRLASLRKNAEGADPETQRRLSEAEAQQAELRRELNDLLEDIEAHAGRLPDDPRLDQLRESALTFAAGVRECGAANAMSDAESALGEGDPETGQAHAKTAADLLESFLGKCEGMGQACQGCLKFQPQLEEQLGDTMNQLLAGTGLGAGGADGYSARHNSLQNVGLYGAQTTDSGGGFGPPAESSGTRGVAARSRAALQQAEPGSTGATTSGGAGTALVPEVYRERVRRYLERLADEGNQR